MASDKYDDSKERVLAALKAAYPAGVSTDTLHRTISAAAKTRVGQLRWEGWPIKTKKTAGCSVYTLTSLVQGAPNGVLAGCKVVYTIKDGWQATTHVAAVNAEAVPPKVLEMALAAASAAYRAILDQHVAAAMAPAQDGESAPSPKDEPGPKRTGLDEVLRWIEGRD